MAMFAESRTLKNLLEEEQWELPTSFIDVVFLLLLYFTLTMKFHTLEQRMVAHLPKDKDSRTELPPPPIIPELVIRVQAQPGAAQAPWYQVDHGWTTTDPNALAGRMAQLKGSCGDKFQVVIDGEQGCPFKHVMAALDACARAGFTKVDFRPPPAAEHPAS